MKTMLSLFMIGLMLLTGCSGGGDESTPASVQSEAPTPRSLQPPPPPVAQPDILTATNQGLQRGKANGQGQRLIFARTNLHQPAFFGEVFLAGGLLYYPRESPPVRLDFPNGDIWSVRTDGTGDHAIRNTGLNEVIADANESYAIYGISDYSIPPTGEPTGLWSMRHDGGAHTFLPVEGYRNFIHYRFLANDRALFDSDSGTLDNHDRRIFSVALNGTDTRIHAAVTEPLTVVTEAVIDNTLVYREYDYAKGKGTLKAVPILGGSIVSLDDGQTYVAYAGHIGGRVISHHCAVLQHGDASACDVVSVNLDGSAPVVLASHAANEAVQGIAGNQVIIRRNLSGNDQLIAVPVTGGAERLLMTMTDNEFVLLTDDEVMILRRPSGTWTLGLNGTLKQIGTVLMNSGFIIVGNAFCGTVVATAWCMPLDGSSPAVKIADTGRVLGAVQ